jgi:hypothetical protein
VLAVTELLPSYGYWKDLLLLLLECKRADVDYTPLHSKVRLTRLFACQFKADAEELEAAAREGRQPRGLSLAAKFAPSEGGYGDYFGYGKVHSAWDTVYEEIAQLFHEVGKPTPTDTRQRRTRRASCCSPATLPP